MKQNSSFLPESLHIHSRLDSYSMILHGLKLGQVASHSLPWAWNYFLFFADDKKKSIWNWSSSTTVKMTSSSCNVPVKSSSTTDGYLWWLPPFRTPAFAKVCSLWFDCSLSSFFIKPGIMLLMSKSIHCFLRVGCETIWSIDFKKWCVQQYIWVFSHNTISFPLPVLSVHLWFVSYCFANYIRMSFNS